MDGGVVVGGPGTHGLMPGKHKDTEQQIQDREIGRRLNRARRDAGLTQKELGAAMDVDQSGISRILAGKQTASTAQLAKAAKALGVEQRSLLPGGPTDLGPSGLPPFSGPPVLDWQDPPVQEWPPGLEPFLEHQAKKLGVTRRERWYLLQTRFRAEPWVRFDEVFWADMLEFWRNYLRREDAQKP